MLHLTQQEEKEDAFCLHSAQTTQESNSPGSLTVKTWNKMPFCIAQVLAFDDVWSTWGCQH